MVMNRRHSKDAFSRQFEGADLNNDRDGLHYKNTAHDEQYDLVASHYGNNSQGSTQGQRDEYIQEKVSTRAGWSYPSFEEEYLLGYQAEIRDFVESVAFGREPRSTGQLGVEVVRVMYAAYQSAEEGRRIEL